MYHALKTFNHSYSIIFTLIIHMITYYSFHVQNHGHPYEVDQSPVSSTHLEIPKYRKNQIQNISAQIELQRPSLYKVQSKPSINDDYTKKSKNQKTKLNTNLKNGCKSQANKFQKIQQLKIGKLIKAKDGTKHRLKAEQDLDMQKIDIKQKNKKVPRKQKSLNQQRKIVSQNNIKTHKLNSKSSSKRLQENNHNNISTENKNRRLSATKSKQSLANRNTKKKDLNINNLKKNTLGQQKSLRGIQIQQNDQIAQIYKQQNLKQLMRIQQLKGLQGKQLLRLKKIHSIERISIQNRIEVVKKMYEQLCKEARRQLSMNQI